MSDPTPRPVHPFRRTRRAALGLAVLASLGTAAAVKTVPYGLKFGMTKAQIEKIVPLAAGKAGIYPSARPTAGWSDFRVTISPDSGLCATTATSSPIPTNEQGVNLLPLLDKLNLTLERAYGTATVAPKNVPKTGMITALARNPALLTSRYKTTDGIDVIVTALPVKQTRAGDPLRVQMQLKYQKNYAACTKDL